MNEQIESLLTSQLLCAVGTHGDNGYPNVATVAFSHTPELKFIFSTDDTTRKADNMIRDNKIAITVTDAENKVTVQAECDVVRLTREDFNDNYAESHFNKLPFTRFFIDISTMSFYIATPVRMKMTDINHHPWQVNEIIR